MHWQLNPRMKFVVFKRNIIVYSFYIISKYTFFHGLKNALHVHANDTDYEVMSDDLMCLINYARSSEKYYSGISF